MERARKVDVEKLTNEQADQIGEEIGRKLSDIAKEAAEKANKLLKIYGLETKMAFEQPAPIKQE